MNLTSTVTVYASLIFLVVLVVQLASCGSPLPAETTLDGQGWKPARYIDHELGVVCYFFRDGIECLEIE